MGRLIARSAGTERILEVFNDTFTQAQARGGPSQAIAESRLGSLHAQLLEHGPKFSEASKAEYSHRRALKARRAESNLEICTVIDEVYNTLGRPAESIEFALIVGTGRQQWTRGSPRTQPVQMAVLADNLRSTEHPRLQARKEEWASRIDAAAQKQTQCVEALTAAEIALLQLTMRRQGLARAAQVMMNRLKRDFLNEGMSQAQIHEIIPSARRRARARAEPEAEIPPQTSPAADTDDDEPAPESAPRSVA